MFFSRNREVQKSTSDRKSSSVLSRLLFLLGGSAIFLVCLLTGFYLSFPEDALLKRLVNELENRARVKIFVQKAALSLPLSWTMREIDLKFDDLAKSTLRIDALQLSPWWSSLLRGAPAIKGNAQLLGGSMTFQARSQGQLFAEAQKLQLDIPLASIPPLQLKAQLASGQLQTEAPLSTTTESLFESEWNSVEIHGLGLFLPDGDQLNLGHCLISLNGKGSSFKLKSLVVSGGELEAQGNGTLLLAEVVQNSRINLTLSIKASQQAQKRLDGLLALSGPKQADGSYRLHLTGTLGRPVLAR